MTATNIIQFPTKFTGTEHSVATATVELKKVSTNPYKDLDTRASAVLLRKKLKEAGYNSRKVSVKTDFYSMGSSINATVRDASVDDKIVGTLCKEAECISYCDSSGEILGGGNTFVKFYVTDEVTTERSAKYLDIAEEIVVKLNELHTEVVYDDTMSFRRTSPYDVSIEYSDLSGRNLYLPQSEHAAATIANMIYKHNAN
jgi:hypothetical protein